MKLNHLILDAQSIGGKRLVILDSFKEECKLKVSTIIVIHATYADVMELIVNNTKNNKKQMFSVWGRVCEGCP